MSKDHVYPSLVRYGALIVGSMMLLALVATCGDEQISDGRQCDSDHPCVGGLVCEDGRCVAPPGCDDENPCDHGSVCQGGVCVRIEGCDEENPCDSGYKCEDGLCVPDFDWTGPGGDPGDIDEDEFCRVDEQCEPHEACVRGHCRTRPCHGVQCPDGEVCTHRCLPTQDACLGVRCAENLEHCVGGACLPTCIPDLCVDPGCNDSDDQNCASGECLEGTICLAGVCIEVEPCADNLFCRSGFVCSLSCAPQSPCDPNPCNPGWSCQVDGDQARCVENLCSGLTCGGGEICVSGTCMDPCEGVPCEEGGRYCPLNNQVCCNRVCCEPGLVCRYGQCLPPAGTCEPPCDETHEICIGDECYCRMVPPQKCAVDECCRHAECISPCDPNPCAAEPQNRLCAVDCSEPAGYVCVDACEGVDCLVPNTVCDPDDGVCRCGSGMQECTGSECCIEAAQDFQCLNPCAGNPCGLGECVVDCSQPDYYQCIDHCVPPPDCPPNNPDCHPSTGECVCLNELRDAYAECSVSECCVAFACESPCSPHPCNVAPNTRCTVDCTLPDGHACSDPCSTANCACNTDPCGRNPNCRTHPNNPNNHQCFCAAADRVCPGGTCCEPEGCVNPCDPNPCDDPTPRCTVRCRVNGLNYNCTDPCTASPCGQPNPDCAPQPDGTRICHCNGNTCTQEQCCIDGGCIFPCEGNPCGDLQCVRDCRQATGFRCVDPCSPNPCSQPTPTCTPTGGGTYQCTCDGAPCSGATACCINDTCIPDPCSPDPCGGLECIRDCSAANGYRCNDPCSPNPCSQPTPTCTPTGGGTFQCTCGGHACGAPTACCLNEVCVVDPCSPDPCGGLAQCVRNCALPGGYQCVDHCSNFTCTDPRNPLCDPLDANAATRCSCNGTHCTGADNCCVDGTTCTDPCSPNPCAAEPLNRKCVRDCSLSSGYYCTDHCANVDCPALLQCNPATGLCGCSSTYEDCGDGICCRVSGSVYECRSRQCTPAECAASGMTCDPCTGCVGGGG